MKDCKNETLRLTGLPIPLDRASCQVVSGRHYTTFDGRLYHFRGDCTYVLSRACVPLQSSSLEYYQVEGEMLGTASSAPRMGRLRVSVYGQDIVIVANATEEVMVSDVNFGSYLRHPSPQTLHAKYHAMYSK